MKVFYPLLLTIVLGLTACGVKRDLKLPSQSERDSRASESSSME